MLISPAWGHGGVDTGSPGGGIALLIILGVAVALLLAYRAQNKWRRRKLKRVDGDE